MKTITGGICAAKGYKAAGIHCGIRKNKSKKSVKGAVSVIYWLVVTAVFLIVSQTGADEPKNIWIIWAVAGVLYGAVAAAVNAFEHSK